MKKLIVIFLAVIFLNTALVYSADKDHHGEQRQHKVKDFLEKENLTPQEQAQLSVYRDSYRKKMEAFREQLKGCRKQLHEVLEQPDPDRGTINKVAVQMKQVQAAMLDARIDGILTMKSMLRDIRAKGKK